MKILVMILGMSMATNLLAQADVGLLDPFRAAWLVYTTPFSSGRILFAEVQDNGQSCLYTFKSITASKRVSEGKISISSVEKRIAKGATVRLVTARSVAIDDVMDSLESRFDNSSKNSELFSVTPEVLSGEYALFQGTVNYRLAPTLYPRKIGSGSIHQLSQAAQKTHSSESVSCAKQPQI